VWFILIDAFIQNFRFLEGNWVLRFTNDKKFKNKYSYLVLQPYNDLKIKSISNGILKTKVSRSGNLILKKNNNPIFKFYRPRQYYNFDEDNNIDFMLIINNYNTYSYSILGLEIPQIKYKEVSDYNLKLNLNIKHKDKTLLVTDLDTNLYYLFDLNTNQVKLPYIEISVTTLLFSKFFDIIISHLLN
jgi:hypothetical protein